MRILCDWVDELRQYNLGEPYIDLLERECKRLGAEITFCHPESLVGNDGSVCAYFGNRFDTRFIELFPNLRWVHFGSVGTDRLPAECANARNIMVTNAAGLFDRSVALHATSLLLASRSVAVTKNGFTRLAFESQYPRTMLETSLLILGTGGIAQQSYKNFETLGFDVHLVARSRSSDQKSAFRQILHAELADYASRRPFLINLLPINETTEYLVDSQYISKFESISGYINLGRRETEVTEDVLSGLRSGKVDFAAWDVVRDLDRVRKIKEEFGSKVAFTPHIAAFHQAHWKASADLVVANLQAFAEGNYCQLRNRVYV